MTKIDWIRVIYLAKFQAIALLANLTIQVLAAQAKLPIKPPVGNQSSVSSEPSISTTQDLAKISKWAADLEPSTPSIQAIELSPIAQAIDPEEEEITVTGDGAQGYRVPSAGTTTRTDTPLRDIPANIQVIPRQVLEDQGGTRVDDALRNVSGITFGNSFGGRLSQFTGRGFPVTQFRNGLLEGSSTGALFRFNSLTSVEIADIEQIEVLKGPASVLFGQVEPGAVINYVSKKPLFRPSYNTSLNVGSYGFFRPTFDFSDNLDAKGNVSYRLNVAIERAESFRDFVETDRIFIAPSLAWKISPRTMLAFEGSFLKDERLIDRGLVALGRGVPDIPISRYLGPGTEPNEFDEKRAYLSLDHQFNDRLSFRSTLRITRSQELRPLTVQAGNLRPDNRTVPLSSSTIDQLFDTYTWRNDLISKFNTGSIRHTVLAGIELTKISGWFNNNLTGSVSSIDLFNPDYSRVVISPLRRRPELDYTNDVKALGIYLQNQIDLLDNLKLVLGGRFDSYDQEELRPSAPNLSIRQTGTAFSPNAGLVYQPSKTLAFYANYARSFQPQIGRDLDRETFKPERGTQYEMGVKADLIPNRLSATLAGYKITKTNVLTSDPRDQNFSIQVGEQRSQGVELDIVGEIIPGWNIIASYAYTDAEIVQDNRFAAGNRLVNIPYNTASLWTTYTLQTGKLKGLGFGAGVFFVDGRSGDLANSFEVPNYARVDASIFYNTGKLRAGINFKNLFDTVYFAGTQSRSSIIPGIPFTVQGSVSVQF
ncbi:MAG: TonB-dependent siderophore receptor [Leptolyngbyaceae cyanobacterium CSU_1_3]|nr:TonB-dependent siderophore receptor [Leptolyngbyaceae cyanobacterium CSU_1_3]